MAFALFVCRYTGARDSTAFIQDTRLVLDGLVTSAAQWGPRRTALKKPEAWWRKHVNAHELGYCTLIPAVE